MNTAAGKNFTTYRSARLEQKLSEIAAQKVVTTTKSKLSLSYRFIMTKKTVKTALSNI